MIIHFSCRHHSTKQRLRRIQLYNYYGSNVLSPSIISPVDLGQLLTEVKQDLVEHHKFRLPSNYEGKSIEDKSLVYRDELFVIISVPLINKSQTLTVYKIHNLSILVPELQKWIRYNIPNDFIAITTNGLYITYLDSNEILSCQLSVRHYCEIYTLFYSIDNPHHCSYYLLQNNDEKVRQFCSLSVMNQTTDQAVSLDYYYWDIITMKPSKLQVICLTASYYVKLKIPLNIIHIPDACEAYTKMVFLPARNSLNKEIDSRKLGHQPTNFDLDYTDVSGFTLVRDIKIPPLTKKELENLATNIPKMAEVTVQSLSTKLQDINRNHPYTMPDWLKIMLSVTSTVIAIIIIAVIIYVKISGNCHHGKCSQNNRKNKKTNLNEFKPREINRSHSILTSHALICRSTAIRLLFTSSKTITPIA